MILGNVSIENGVLRANHTFYNLSEPIDAKADRIFQVPGYMGAGLVGLFGAGFFDLLTNLERLAVAIIFAACVFASRNIAHLIIVKSALRGSELSIATVGTYPHIRRLADEIVTTAAQLKPED